MSPSRKKVASSIAVDPAEWMRYAVDNYWQGLRDLRARKHPSFNGAIANSQQAIEKSLKAILLAQGRELIKVHDLVLLLKALDPLPPELLLMESQLDKVFVLAGLARYPGEQLGRESAREALRIAKRCIEVVALHLKLPADLD